MLQIIHCTYCGKEGNLEVNLRFTAKIEPCRECNHNDVAEWSFYFCNIKCFTDWIEKAEIKEKGIPCQSCRDTGWAFGFESNGICEICNGTKRLAKCISPFKK